MGHKFSDLKRIYGSMENKQKILNIKHNHQIDNTIGMINKLEMSEQNDSSSSCENNGNGVDKHFESIYSNGAESLKLQEENGNILSGPESANCSCSQPTTDDVSEENKSRRTSSSKSLSFVSGKRSRTKTVRSPKDTGTKKKRNNWVLKFNCARLKSNGACSSTVSETDIPESNISCDSCVCTGYRRTEEHHLGAGVVFDSIHPGPSTSAENDTVEDPTHHPQQQQQQIVVIQQAPPTLAEQMIDMSRFNPEDYPIEDCDERARQERAREIAEGVDPPPGFLPGQHIQLLCPPDLTLDNLTALFQTHLGIQSASAALSALSQLDASLASNGPSGAHTQVDYIHCLVPDLLQITSCSFYWGKMDRYEAERLLEGRPEGTFLLRDSAQEEYLFSVSFRKYGRSLHARIEQWNHNFSFDSHDPGVFASPTVCGLIEHYKDPSCCMFFEPMLTIPLHRNFTFPLQHLCRAVICNRSNYDSINKLQLPKTLKCYLKEYHYKQRIRVRDLEHQSRS